MVPSASADTRGATCPDRHLDADGRAPSRRGLDLELSVDLLGAAAHGGEAVVPVAGLLDVEASPTVLDLEGHVVLADFEEKARRRHAGVLDHVRQSLARDPVALDLRRPRA